MERSINLILFSLVISTSIRDNNIPLEGSKDKFNEGLTPGFLERRHDDFFGNLGNFFNKVTEEIKKIDFTPVVNVYNQVKDSVTKEYNKIDFDSIINKISDQFTSDFAENIHDIYKEFHEIIPEDSNQEIVDDYESIEEAKHFMFMAGASYLNSNRLRSFNCYKYRNTLKIIEDIQINKPGLRAVILEDTEKKDLIISFRGATEPNLVKELTQINQIQYDDESEHQAHKKVVEYLNIILPEILKNLEPIISDYEGYRLVLVGHSLGGGLALLAAPKLYNEFHFLYRKIAIFTYNQLKVVNSALANWFNDKPMSILRVVNKKDIVAKYPFIGDFAHTKRVIKLDEQNDQTQYTIHHSLWGSYIGHNQCVH